MNGKFTKEAQGLFTGHKSMTWGMGQNKIPTSLERTARVDPEEVRNMLDEFETWEQQVKSGQATTIRPDVTMAGLWIPMKEMERFPGETVFQRLRKTTYKVDELRSQFLQIKHAYSMTDNVISSSGNPTIDPNQLEAVIQKFEAHLQSLLGASKSGSQQAMKAAQDCQQKISALMSMRKPLSLYEMEARKFQSQTYNNRPYIRVGSEVWLNDGAMRNIFFARAIGVDRRAKRLMEMLLHLQEPKATPQPPPGTGSGTPAGAGAGTGSGTPAGTGSGTGAGTGAGAGP